MQVPVYNLAGDITSQIQISDAVFGVPFNEAVVHQALVRQQANARQGTASTKTRGEVAGSTRKLYRQKHTGMARAGNIRSPLRRKGGIIFGPKPRSYHQSMPKKMRRLALRCLLSGKAGEGELKVVEELKMEQPKTGEMRRILAVLGVESPALVVTEQADPMVVMSARNLEGIRTTPADLLNVVDLLSYRRLLMTLGAVRRVEKLWGQEIAQGETNAPV